MQTLHTVLYTFPKVLTKENELNDPERPWLLIITAVILMTSEVKVAERKSNEGKFDGNFLNKVWRLDTRK